MHSFLFFTFYVLDGVLKDTIIFHGIQSEPPLSRVLSELVKSEFKFCAKFKIYFFISRIHFSSIFDILEFGNEKCKM